MTKFGPNKTNKQFYLQVFLITIIIIVLSLVSTAVLLSVKPELKDVITTFFKEKTNFITVSRVDSDQEDALEFKTHSNRVDSEENEGEENENNEETLSLETLPPDLFPETSFPDKPSVLNESVNVSDKIPSSEAIDNRHPQDSSDKTTSTESTESSFFRNETADEEHQLNPNEVQGEVISANHVKLPSVDKIQGSEVVVSLSSLGKLKGIEANVFGKRVHAFLGVPFAQPPINSLRFKRTVPVKPWKGVLDATSFKPHCPQHFEIRYINKRSPLTNDLAEDCLYLNIWSPVDEEKGDESDPSSSSSPRGVSKKNKKAGKPVMLWFFGGGYSGGSNNIDEFDGRVLASLGDVIVITANYRVGPFGFLDLGVNDAPGNQGLYDNKQALLWTRDNVASFGGDPEQITIFGQSAGAITTGLFMVNNHTSRLFKRAILQSGSPVMLNFFFNRVEDTAERFINAMNCTSVETEGDGDDDLDSSESSETDATTPEEALAEDRKDFQRFTKRRNEELSCLMKKSTQEMIIGQKKLMETAFPFTPSPFEEFLPLMATDALKAQPGSKLYYDSLNNVQDVLIGSNSDEGSVILHLEIPEIFEQDKIHLNITTLSELKDLLVTNFSKEFNIDKTTANLFANLFFSSGQQEDTTLNLVKRLYNVIGGLAFTCPVAVFADGLTGRGVNVYQYEFGYRSSASPWGSWMGVTHGDEYIFTFGYPLRYPSKYSKEDAEVSKRMIEIWSHFARTGRVPKQNNKKWPKYSRERGDFMKINYNNSRVSYKIQESVCSLFSVGLESFQSRRRRQLGYLDVVSSRALRQVIQSFAKYSTM